MLVSGLPAAGKTTLATRLGRDLAAPVVRRDDIRLALQEALALGHGAPGLPAAASAMTMLMVTAVLDSGGVAVLDGNFNTEQYMRPVRDLLAARPVPAVEVCLWGEPDELRRRFVERAAPPLTPDLEPYFEQVLSRQREPVLDETVHQVIDLDTTDPTLIDAEYLPLLSVVRRTLAITVSSGEQ